MRMTDDQKKIVEDNQRLVGYVLNKLHISYDNPMHQDLLQDGYLALCKSAMSYDPEKGYKFSTFACMNIEFTLRKKLRKDYATSLYLDRPGEDLLGHARKYFFMIDAGSMTDEDAIREIGCTAEEYYAVKCAVTPRSLFEEIQGKDSTIVYYQELVEDPSQRSIEEDFESEEFKEALLKITESLPYRKEWHRDMMIEDMTRRLNGESPRQSEYAKKYGVTQSIVSRVLIKHYDRVKQRLYKDYGL